jgi:hypothetical protein
MLVDSIFVYKLDSVIIKDKGDSVLIEKWRVYYKDRLIEKTDTVFVAIKKENMQVIEKKESKWSSFLRQTGIIALSLLFIIILYFIIKFFIRKKV